MLHDPLGVASNSRDGLAIWGNRFFGPSSVTQAALPSILKTPAAWFDEDVDKLKTNADIVESTVASIPGLSCSRPGVALYVLVRID